MELGVVAWLTDRGVGIAELAAAVEQAGLESLFLTEHTHVPVSRRDLLDDEVHSQDSRLLDQFTVLGAAAAVTSRLKLGTGICIVPQRDPIILAKQVATIDHLSGGRFVFGVAAGWLAEEMRNHGVRPHLDS
jgi:alkanesulfonate monooxygenase SsuD/methylene tetrahydromethanopterin reductase-like flavin-dependent oxidoreductase (luciferase family)